MGFAALNIGASHAVHGMVCKDVSVCGHLCLLK